MRTTPEVFFCTGISLLGTATPIIGPPKITLESDSSSISIIPVLARSATTVPTGTTRFFGVLHAPPVTVNPRSISGLPSLNASAIAHNVPTLDTTQPTSIGRPPDGTCLPVIAVISIFSPPCGYFVLRTCIPIFIPALTCGFSWMAFSTSGSVCFLFSSIATTPSAAFMIFITIERPSMILSGISKRVRSSIVK